MDDKVYYIYNQLCKVKDKTIPVQLLTCNKCDFYSYAISDMTRHNKSIKHLNNMSDNNIDKKYNCEKCNYTTDDKSHMNRHNKKHLSKQNEIDYIKILTI